jgi:transketolase
MIRDTMRERFVDVTSALLDTDPHLALILADIGVSGFAATGAVGRHPDRVVNVGIREQLLIGVAAGMALEGFRPIVHTYAPFLVERPFEQVKLDLGHNDLGAVLVSVGASHDWAAGGRTHQAPGDVALLSTLADWEIHVPGHPDEVEVLLRSAAAGHGRVYIRLSEQTNDAPMDIARKGFTAVRRGRGAAPVVIAVGPMLDRVILATAGLDVTVLYAATVRPFDGEGLRSALEGPEVVLVEPYLAGTSAGEVDEALIDTPHRLLTLGVPRMELRRYGTASEHDAAHGLDARGLRSQLARFFEGASVA